jgi:hypothetical protein
VVIATVSTTSCGLGGDASSNVHDNQAIRCCQRSPSRSGQGRSIKVIALSGNLEQIEVLGWVEELDCDDATSDNADVAIVVIDLIPAVEMLHAAQLY